MNASKRAALAPDARRVLAVLLAIELFAPVLAFAHSAGQLDIRGCHEDRRRGEYHCHVGEYRGLRFNSKGDFMQQVAAGKTVDQMRQEQGIDAKGESIQEDDDGGWLSHIPFIGKSRREEMHDVGGGEVIVPRGIEERLRALKDLHDKGLISEDEYAAKRKEILGEL